MILPRRLMTLVPRPDDPPGKLRFCEADDPKQAMNFHGPGYPIPDVEAERIGLKAYLDATGWGATAFQPGEKKVTEAAFAKSVAQAETEDKAVAAPDAEQKAAAPGLHITPAADENVDAKVDEKDEADQAQRRGGRRGPS